MTERVVVRNGGASATLPVRRRRHRIFLLVMAMVSAAALLWRGGTDADDHSTPHVVFISIDALLPEDLARPHPRLELPALQALGAAGATAAGVEGAYPSGTFPAHATFVTGVRPARHGVFEEWRFEASAIQAPTLWERASASGLRTAAVSWPATVGAPIDALIPEIEQYSDRDDWLDAVRAVSTPALVDEVVAAMGGFGPRENRHPERRDAFTAAAAAHVLRTRRPHLLLVRFVEVNLARHVAGRTAPEVDAALVRIDARVGEIVSR